MSERRTSTCRATRRPACGGCSGRARPQVVAFASGRESCGRTTLLVQTAAALAAAGHGVVIIDENPAPEQCSGRLRPVGAPRPPACGRAASVRCGRWPCRRHRWCTSCRRHGRRANSTALDAGARRRLAARLREIQQRRRLRPHRLRDATQRPSVRAGAGGAPSGGGGGGARQRPSPTPTR